MARTILQRYYDLLGEEFDPATCELKRSLRVNTLKISSEELVKRLTEKGANLEKIPFLKDAYWYTAEFSLASSTEYLLGLFYMQEGASQIPPLVLLADLDLKTIDENNPPLILDMAAAPGSKTTQLAALTKDKVPIIAIDNHAPRLQILANNLDRLGIKSVMTYRKDARYADDLEKEFDYVLLDAPCSGNFCIEKDYFMKRSISDIAGRSKLQKELLRAAYLVLKKEGTLVYSTCSLEQEEDEEVIDWFLETYPDMKLEKIELSIGDDGLTKLKDKTLNEEISKTKRFWPHRTGLQGFYIAKMRKL